MATTRTIADLPGPRGVPLLGNAPQLKPSRFHLILEDWVREYGPMYRLRLGPNTAVVLSDPAVMNPILQDRPEGFRRLKVFEKIFDEAGAHGIFSVAGEEWERHRRLANPALGNEHLRAYFEVIRTTTERLRSRLAREAEQGGPVDIQRVFMSYTLDTAASLAFGEDVNTLEHPEDDLPVHVARVFEALARRTTIPFPYWRFVKLPFDRALDRTLVTLRAAVAKFGDNARAQLRERPELRTQPENFLQSMVAAQEADGSFTDYEIAGNTLTLLVVGEDTTAHTLSWATWYLAREPEVQQELARAALEQLGDESSAQEYETAAGFAFGEAVLREVLRLKPAVPVIGLEPIEDTVIDGVAVPAGVRLLLLPRMAALRPTSFSDPERFDPSRWTADGQAEGRVHDPSAFLSFGAGRRACLGYNLALLEGKAALAMIARNFEVELDESGGPVTERNHFTMGPQDLRIRLRALEPAEAVEVG